jgi:hypothetical protein
MTAMISSWVQSGAPRVLLRGLQFTLFLFSFFELAIELKAFRVSDFLLCPPATRNEKSRLGGGHFVSEMSAVSESPKKSVRRLLEMALVLCMVLVVCKT